MYTELGEVREKLEKHNKDMQGIEFIIQEGKLYLLRNKNGKRPGITDVKNSAYLFNEGIIDKDQALL